MEIPLNIFSYGIDVFLLVLVRMTGMFVIAPLFGRRNIPTYFKIGFAFMCSLVVMNTLVPVNLSSYGNIFGFSILVLKEFFVGLGLGFISYFAFMAVYMAGQIIDMQIGFGMVNVLDPMSNIQVPVTANFYFIIAMLVMLITNSHHALIRAIFESYSIVPIGKEVFNENNLSQYIDMAGKMVSLGFKLSAPIISTILIVDVVLGVVSKTIPQMNFFAVGVQLKLIVGMIVMILTIQGFFVFIDALMNGMNSGLMLFLKSLVTENTVAG